jgi:class 3 adenylate cyclase/tetratricopeptide (TPR) repeat protein
VSANTCTRCGSLLPEDAQFCPKCGWPVAPAAEERKVVTVLFADVAGSTELTTRLDPERIRELQGAFYRMASDEIAALRGRTEKFAGDAVMAVFGLPKAHDDDALRAVRAGLMVRDRAERLGEDLGIPLQVHVGINTGAAVTGAAPAGELLVSGAPVNLAARLQQAAAPGEVLVGHTTWQLTREAAEFGEARIIEAPGFDGEVEARPVLRLSSRSTRRTIPLVDRRRELELLRSAVERAMEGRRAHLVTLVGEPGIGKSRLVQELVAGLPEGTELLTGRASEFGEDVTFAPLVDMVRRRLAIEGDAEPHEVAKRLEEVVNGCCDASEVERVTAQLGMLLGLGDEQRQQDPYRSAEIRAGLLTFIEGLARTAPVVMVLEDLHLARPALLELIEELVRGARRLPHTVVAVGREDLLKERPTWGAGIPDALTLRLEPMSVEESRELAAAAGDRLDEETVDRIARSAGGNPFFIVETTGMLLHEADAHSHGTPPRGMLPPTVQAVVASRIDHLEEPARNLIRTASIFPGGAFHESQLALVTEADPDVLKRLEDEELIVRDEDRRGRWLFRHELLRAVAYESLSKRERRRLHERVAAALDQPEAPEPHVQQLAYHLEKAALAARDLDPTDGEPALRAVAALRRAGDLSRWRMESVAAVDLYERALAIAGPESSWGPEETRALAGIGEAKYWLGEYEEAEAALRKALELGEQDPWTRELSARFLGDIALNIHGDPDRAEELFTTSEEAAREMDDRWALSRTLLMSGWVRFWRNDYDGARARFEQALEIAKANPEGDRTGEARALVSLAGVASQLGNPREALALADAALEVGREIGHPFTVATAQERRATSLRAMWRLDEALPASNEAVRIYRDLGARWELASALGDRGTLLRLLGRPEESEADLREALSLCRELGDRVLVVWTASELAIVLALRGKIAEAHRVIEDPSLPEGLSGPADRTALLWARGFIALAEGDRDAALKYCQEALEIDRDGPSEVSEAISVWWVAGLFGADAAGGEAEVERARAVLERQGWTRVFHETEQIREAFASVHALGPQ